MLQRCEYCNFKSKLGWTNCLGFGLQQDEEKVQTAFNPPPSFSGIMLQIIFDWYGCIYARRYDGQIVWNACTRFPEVEGSEAPSSKCVSFWLFPIQKNIPWALTLLFCFNFMLKKPCLKFPKSATYIFWIESASPPLGTFPKFHPIWRSHPSQSMINKEEKKEKEEEEGGVARKYKWGRECWKALGWAPTLHQSFRLLKVLALNVIWAYSFCWWHWMVFTCACVLNSKATPFFAASQCNGPQVASVGLC